MNTQSFLKKVKNSLAGLIDLDFGTIRSLNLSWSGVSLNFCFQLFVHSFTMSGFEKILSFYTSFHLYIFNKGKNEKIFRN